jgi:hypothetical protein
MSMAYLILLMGQRIFATHRILGNAELFTHCMLMKFDCDLLWDACFKSLCMQSQCTSGLSLIFSNRCVTMVLTPDDAISCRLGANAPQAKRLRSAASEL